MSAPVKPEPTCRFCKDKPVINAASWISSAPRYAQCPACGRQPDEYDPPADVGEGPEEANDR